MLETAAISLGKVVGQRAGKAWMTARAAEDHRAKDLVELIQLTFVDQIHARRVQRQLEEIADQVAERMITLCAVEYGDMSDGDKAAALAEVKETLAEADLSDAVLLGADADPRKLAEELRRSAPQRGSDRQLGEAGAHVYEVVLTDCCDCLIRIVRELPEFTPRVAAETLGRLTDISTQVSAMLTRLPIRTLDAPQGLAGDGDFERRYLSAISHALDTLELFGVRIEKYRPRTSLSVAYISLTVSAAGDSMRAIKRASGISSGSLDDWRGDAHEPTQATVRVETALGRSKLILVRGEAGSGKSTLLRWLAISSARGTFAGELSSWNGYTPFLIKLRSYADQRLPRPEELLDGLTGIDLSVMPTAWTHRRLLSGRALLLVDGVDELKAAQRKAVRTWLSGIIQAYPELRVVVTSRPAAADAKWLDAEGFASVFLERMSPADVKSLIRHWHDAARHAGGLPCDPDRLPGFEASLLARLETGPHLRALATSPLLAAMLCALNLDRDKQLPRDRMGLYEAAIELLLERRDAEREIPSNLESALERPQKAQILQDLAWRLSEFGRSELPKQMALNRIAEKLTTMPHLQESPEAVLEHLLQRSGILREPVAGRIDFIHRTVQEYLAAKQIADDADIELLISRAHQDQWRETVIMTAGHANRPLREQLMTGLLERIDAEPKRARQLKILAASCLETLHSIPVSLREKIELQLESLLPPSSLTIARSLAAIGEPVLMKLPVSLDGLTTPVAQATVRTAYLVNGQSALEKLAGFGADERRDVQHELNEGWSYFDPELYAQKVLADTPWVRQVDIPVARLLPALKYLKHLRSLRIVRRVDDLNFLDSVARDLEELSLAGIWSMPHPSLDLRPLIRFSSTLSHLGVYGTVVEDPNVVAQFKRLQSLVFDMRSHSSIGFIRDLVELYRLDLRGLQKVSSFVPLEALSLRTLRLRDCLPQADLSALPLAPSLRSLDLHLAGMAYDLSEIVDRIPNISALELYGLGDLVSVEALEPLRLKLLTLGGCPRLRNIEALDTQKDLEYLTLTNNAVADIAALGSLAKLKGLQLMSCRGLQDLTPLENLANLQELTLYDVGPNIDLAPLARNRNLRIRVGRGQRVQGGELFGQRLTAS
ncbi:hypothetical protein ABH926_005072 [Catenulispora sp. GP43]|uniref:NACHT domain-containing protein n=1 Tax=Catenulispora sp. GP43 TaxID=3156263 RepID=UPI003511DACC